MYILCICLCTEKETKINMFDSFPTRHSSTYNSISINEQTAVWIVMHLTKIILMIPFHKYNFYFYLN